MIKNINYKNYLIILFFLFAVSIIITAIINYNSYNENYRVKAEHEMKAIAELKSGEIEQFIKERKADAGVFFKNPAFTALVKQYLYNNDRQAEFYIKEWLQKYRTNYAYENVILTDTSCLVRAAAIPADLHECTHIKAMISGMHNTVSPVFLDLHRDGEKKPIHFSFISPIIEENGNTIGFLVLWSDPEHYLYPLIKKWPTASKTAETLIVRREGNHAIFLNELRFVKDSALTLKIPMEKTDVAAVKAILGHRGAVEATDYRRVPVIAVLKELKGTPWHMVTRVDRAEIYGPVKERFIFTVLTSMLILLLFGAGLVILWRHQNVVFYREKLKISESLRENEQKLSIAMKAAKQGFFDVNFSTGETRVNDEFYTMLGYDPADFTETFSAFIERLHPDDIERVLKNFSAVKGGDTADDRIEFRQRTKDGAWKWILSFAKVVEYDGTGKPFRMLGTHIDITDLKLAEEKIAEEKERLMVTLRSIGDGVITTDLNGKVTIINKVAENLTGWTLAEAYGRNLSEVFHVINELTREVCRNPVELVLSTGNIIELANHTLLISRDGTERIIADSGAPIKDKDSKTIGVVLVFRDITEKQALQENMQRAEKLNSLGVLAGGIAHDFNNLLNAIYGYIQLSMDTPPGDPAKNEYMEKSLHSFNQAKDLTHQLLTFSKGGSPVRKTGDLKSLLREYSSFTLSGSNITHELNFDGDLWLCDFDENQIAQVINNMLINAKHAMPFGGKIKISAINEIINSQNNPGYNGKFIKISITDTGTGIPPDVLPKIFDPFFTTKKEGTGLGLASSHSIIHSHDGFIEVESEPGRGTTFSIYLPASRNTTVHVSPSVNSNHKGSGIVILMDDEDYMREIAGRMLQEMGYSVIDADEGKVVLDYLLKSIKDGFRVEAVFLDLTNQKGMGGLETIKELRKIDTTIPVFAVSGYSEDHIMSKPEENGFTGSLGKPFRKSELAELLNLYLK